MEAVFVYGTLKRGERNHPLVRPYLHRVLPGFVEGFRLYHLPQGPHRPYAYPGMVPGRGGSLGRCFSSGPRPFPFWTPWRRRGRSTGG